MTNATHEHANRLSVLLYKTDWSPSRAHVEQARNALVDAGATINTQAERIASLSRDLEEARETMEPIADLYRLLANQANGFSLMREGVSNGDFQRIALLHKRLSSPASSEATSAPAPPRSTQDQ